jgi:TonB family protein
MNRAGSVSSFRVRPASMGGIRGLAIVAALLAMSLAGRARAQESGGGKPRSQLPRVIEAVSPTYPDSLRSLGLEGNVVLQAAIDTSGQVEPATVKVVKSLHPLLDQACIEALLATRFAPASYGGRAVRVVMQIPYTFNFEEAPPPAPAGADSVPLPAGTGATSSGEAPGGAPPSDQ